MRTIGEIRRLRLEALQRELGLSFAEMNSRLGRSRRDATLSQISKALPNSGTGRQRQMGDDQARAIETAFDKPAGWLDRDPDFDLLLKQGVGTMRNALQVTEPPALYQRPRWPFGSISEAQLCRLAPHVLAALEAVILGFLAGTNVQASESEQPKKTG